MDEKSNSNTEKSIIDINQYSILSNNKQKEDSLETEKLANDLKSDLETNSVLSDFDFFSKISNTFIESTSNVNSSANKSKINICNLNDKEKNELIGNLLDRMDNLESLCKVLITQVNHLQNNHFQKPEIQKYIINRPTQVNGVNSINFSESKQKLKNSVMESCSSCKQLVFINKTIDSKCSKCSKYVCSACIINCLSCYKQICNSCSKCKICNQSKYCSDCKSGCNQCVKENSFCKECIKLCEPCKKTFCKKCCSFKCQDCKGNMCLICSWNCKVCLGVFCNNYDNGICKSCDLKTCNICLINCQRCSKSTCKNCIIKCNNCNIDCCKKCSYRSNKTQKIHCNDCLS